MLDNLKRSNDPIIEKKFFLEDKPLENLNEDKFQYAQVAEILFELLKQKNFPINIGLFGPWGSGKTSIVKLLQNIIAANSQMKDQFIIKVISVWKFADDAPSLHRKIVREIEAELDIRNDEGLDKDSTITESAAGTGIFSILFFNKHSKLTAIGFILIFLSLITLAFFYPNISSALNGVLLLASFTFIYKVVQPLLGNYQRGTQLTTKSLPLIHGDQYETRFKMSVDRYLKKNKGQNLILVFDDMDRLPPPQMLAALNTIKTFLNSKHVAFIIPCDEIILRNGVKTAFEQKEIIEDLNGNISTKNHYVSEFINKTFDYQIHLPILEQKNMKRYAKNLIIDQKISWIKDNDINIDRVLGALIHSSIKTPRQVKSLINSFSANWQLAKKRDQETGRNLLSANPLAIAVFTVLQTDFPDYYSELIVNPYLITQEHKHLDEALTGYLSKIDSFIPKDDPRPFIYFSNEKLNPATGKPEIVKIKEYLLNAEIEQFKASFENLKLEDKQVVLAAVISDIDDNPGLEVDNTIKTLIESEVDLSMISEMDLHNWEILIRENLNFLHNFPPTKVCYFLDYILHDDRLWIEYGAEVNITLYKEDILYLWIERPDYINRLNKPDFSILLENSFIDDNDGYTLLSVILQIPANHSINKNVNWIRVLKDSLDLNVTPEFTITAWLEKWVISTDSNLNSELINELLEIYDFKSEEFLDGIGLLWCNHHTNDDEVLGKLISLTVHPSFSGFNEHDLFEVNNFMKEVSNYDLIRDNVRSILDDWRENENNEKLNFFIKRFPDCPGIPGFCQKNFSFDLDEVEQELYLNILINRSDVLNNFGDLIETLKTEIENAASNSAKSLTPGVIRKLNTSQDIKESILSNREAFLSITDKFIWLKFNELVFEDRLDIFFELWADDEEAYKWIFEGINNFANISKGFLSNHYQYKNNSTNYLNQIVNRVCDYYTDANWDEILENWYKIPQSNNPNITFDLFTLLDSQTKINILGQLSRRCKVNSKVFNNILFKHYDSSVTALRKALFNRWEFMGTEERVSILSNLNTEESKLLEYHFKSNPLIEYLDEIIIFEIDEEYRNNFIKVVINNLPKQEVIKWVNDSIDIMNQEGFQKWRAAAIKIALEDQKVDITNAQRAIETSLALGNERAEIALILLLNSTYTKTELRKFKDKIIRLHNQFPEYVDRFGFRFKKKEII